jgi:hypothetical protein
MWRLAFGQHGLITVTPLHLEVSLLIAEGSDDEAEAHRVRRIIAKDLLAELSSLTLDERRMRLETLAREPTYSGTIAKAVLERLRSDQRL